MKGLVQLGFGVAFGFVLANNGAADFDEMTRMFLFESYHLYGVGLAATVSAIVLLALLRRSKANVRWVERPIHRGTVFGSAVFGVGWALSGACPGTALVQLGQGHLVALATIFGIFVGQALARRVTQWLGWSIQSCG